jgi:hypothetical protein
MRYHEVQTWLAVPKIFASRPYREEGTCEWIWDMEGFLEWKKSGTASRLWVYGLPGEFVLA